MANKSLVRVQVSLRRIVNFTDENSAQDGKAAANDKTSVRSKRSKIQGSR
jgi:hypothetical protein